MLNEAVVSPTYRPSLQLLEWARHIYTPSLRRYWNGREIGGELADGTSSCVVPVPVQSGIAIPIYTLYTERKSPASIK